jgi:hypothetical protein
MKCPKCQIENKEGAKICRKCGTDLAQKPLWKPSWKWHGRTLAVIYAVLIVLFFTLNALLKPYMREIPKDITPWLKDLPKQEAVG